MNCAISICLQQLTLSTPARKGGFGRSSTGSLNAFKMSLQIQYAADVLCCLGRKESWKILLIKQDDMGRLEPGQWFAMCSGTIAGCCGFLNLVLIWMTNSIDSMGRMWN